VGAGARLRVGLAEYHLTQETRVYSVMDDVSSNIRQAVWVGTWGLVFWRHRVPLDSRDEDSMYVG